jgi:hypothetical protein
VIDRVRYAELTWQSAIDLVWHYIAGPASIERNRTLRLEPRVGIPANQYVSVENGVSVDDLVLDGDGSPISLHDARTHGSAPAGKSNFSGIDARSLGCHRQGGDFATAAENGRSKQHSDKVV